MIHIATITGVMWWSDAMKPTYPVAGSRNIGWFHQTSYATGVSLEHACTYETQAIIDYHCSVRLFFILPLVHKHSYNCPTGQCSVMKSKDSWSIDHLPMLLQNTGTNPEQTLIKQPITLHVVLRNRQGLGIKAQTLYHSCIKAVSYALLQKRADTCSLWFFIAATTR